jgi:hypothetical protein
MNGAGNPLNYGYRDPRHIKRCAKLVVRNPDGRTEGKHPRDADVDVMREIHDSRAGAVAAGDPGEVPRL